MFIFSFLSGPNNKKKVTFSLEFLISLWYSAFELSDFFFIHLRRFASRTCCRSPNTTLETAVQTTVVMVHQIAAFTIVIPV